MLFFSFNPKLIKSEQEFHSFCVLLLWKCKSVCSQYNTACLSMLKLPSQRINDVNSLHCPERKNQLESSKILTCGHESNSGPLGFTLWGLALFLWIWTDTLKRRERIGGTKWVKTSLSSCYDRDMTLFIATPWSASCQKDLVISKDASFSPGIGWYQSLTWSNHLLLGFPNVSWVAKNQKDSVKLLQLITPAKVNSLILDIFIVVQ